jgi:hypothetical protein
VTAGSYRTASTPATGWAEDWPATFVQGTAIPLDLAGALFTAIGAGNLRAWSGTEAVGHAGLAN